MATRKVVKIDEELCNGCGECVPACAEGAIQIIDGKARLMADNLCDGLGACLGDCPEGAISIEEREADGFDEEAVKAHLDEQRKSSPSPEPAARPAMAAPPPHGGGGGCPGARMLRFEQPAGTAGSPGEGNAPVQQVSELRHWPIQLHLVPPAAPFLKGADLLLAADCTAFAMADFHATQLKGRSLVVACPKLDQGQEIYLEKLVGMIDEAQINTLSILVMEVPCCGGLIHLAQEAVKRAARKVPVKKSVVSLRGDLLSEEWL